MGRHELDDFDKTAVLRLYQKDAKLAHTICIGTFLFIYDTYAKKIRGLYQAISPPVFYVSKKPIDEPCILVQTRLWFDFASVSTSALPYSLHHQYRRVISRKAALGIMSAFFEKDKEVPYPGPLLLPTEYNSFSFQFTINIAYDEFKAGERIRNHPTYQRFIQSNGWGYLELLGKGSLDEKAQFVVSSDNTPTIHFYTCDGIRVGSHLVKKEIELMVRDIKEEYEKWCEEKDLQPYPKE